VNLKNTRALVIGFGRSGRAAAGFIQRQGGQVRVVDRADSPELRAAVEAARVESRLGGYAETDLDGRDLVVVSPGVPWDLPLLEAARHRGIRVTSEIDLFFTFCPAPIAGITGTNGKTTTTALTADVFSAGGLRVMRGGNIGETVLDRLDQVTADTWMVLELSSFQLESIATPRLRIGAILNVSQNHLDRHHTFERYRDVKARAIAFMNGDDTAVLNADDASYAHFVGQTSGRVLPFSTRQADPRRAQRQQRASRGRGGPCGGDRSGPDAGRDFSLQGTRAPAGAGGDLRRGPLVQRFQGHDPRLDRPGARGVLGTGGAHRGWA
jgi:UDP-N-acetylmuramoylalanine--D-glutamate ligase